MKRFWALLLAVLLASLSGCTDTYNEPVFLSSQKDLSLVYKNRSQYSALFYEGVVALEEGKYHVFVESIVSKFTGTTLYRPYYLPFDEFNTQLPGTPYPGKGDLRRQSRISYDHDSGTFTLDSTSSGSGEKKIPANFEEQYTLHEEWCINHGAAAVAKPNDFLQVLNAAQACFLAGYDEDSMSFTAQLKNNWGSFDRYTTEGGMLNEYHTLMGRHALREGRKEDAVEHLMQSVNVKRPSAEMVSFGPNTILARELLLKGEDAAVHAYLDRIAEFWETEPVVIWKEKINRGRLPALNIHSWDAELQARDYQVNEATLSRGQVLEILNGNTVWGFYDNKGWDIRFNLFFGPDGTIRFGDRYGSDTASWAVTDDGCIEVTMRWNRSGKCLHLEAGENGRLMLYPGVYSVETKLTLMEGEHEYVESACVREFRNKNYEKALANCLVAAESNDMEAQNLLGVIHEFHLGDRKDYQEAMRWYQLAAEQGERFAPYNLGQLYRTGSAGVQDLPKAVDYYRRSAERGFGEAQFSLGVMYFEGAGTAVDMKMAKYWWEKAQENGVARAEEALGRIP